MPLPRPLQTLRVRSGEPLVPTLIRVCASLGAHARRSAALRDSRTSVHQLRLVAKALRAIIRITDGGQPAPDLAALDRQIRNAATRLAGARDKAVQSELLHRMVRKEPRRVRTAARALTDSWPGRAPSGQSRLRAATRLARCADSLGAHLEGRVDAPGIVRAVAHSIRKTRRWRQRASTGGDPASFHAWRRWQKRVEAQFRLVLDRGAKGRRRRLARLHRLQEELGHLHDADQLSGRMERERWPAAIPVPERERIIRLVSQRSQRLRNRVLKRSTGVFANDIPALARKAERLWQEPGRGKRKPSRTR